MIRKPAGGRRNALVILLLLISSGLFAAGLAESPELIPEALKPEAREGVLDLRDFSFTRQAMAELRGEWEFFWEAFVQPGHSGLPDGYVSSGSNWNGGGANPPRGFASYRLTLLLPQDPPRTGPFVLHFREIGSAARIYWNGELVARTGRAASTEEFAQGEWRSGVTSDLPWSQEVEIIVHISNYDNINGGLVDNLIFGTSSAVRNYYESTLTVNFFVLGILLIMAVYHLFMFFIRSSEEAPFWFAMAALFLGLRAMVVDTFPLTVILPGILIEPVLRLNYLSFTVPLLSVTLFVHHSYKSDFGRLLSWISAVGSILYSGLIVFAPLPVFTEYLVPFQLFALIIALGLLAVVLWAVISRKPLSGAFFMGFFAIMATAVFDIIKTMLVLPFPSLTSLGMVLFIVILSMNLSRRTTHALVQAEGLSRQLQNINNAMERFVPREFLKFLHRSEITEVELGDHSEEFLTVMFADLKDFTAIAENSEPGEVFRLINDFLAGMAPIIRKNKGFVDKYLGDGIMALFSGNSSNAIQAAIEMQQQLDHINRERNEGGLNELAMGIGIHTGSCMLGTIGEFQRMDGTVISDAVNLSSRLQNLTRQFRNRILISGEAFEHAMNPERFYLRNIGSFKVKGRGESVDVIEVMNADPQDIWKQKRGCRKDFERAVYYYRESRIVEARELFAICRKKAPGDPAAAWYLKQLG